MSKLDFLKDLNDIDESLIREAEPNGSEGEKRQQSRRILRTGVLAAAAVLLAVGVGVWMKQQDSRIPAETSRTETEAPTSAEKEENSAASLPENSTEETKTAEILYEDERTVVRRSDGRSRTSQMAAEACLAYLTERELFCKCDVVLRARINSITNISIENRIMNMTTDACLVEVEPLEILRGDLKGTGTVQVFIDRHINTSLEDLNYSLRTMQTGTEGFLMLYDVPDYAGYMKALADYTVGDNQRYAIWGRSGESGLSYASEAYPGFSRDWDLDQAEAYIRSLLDESERAPSDFALTLRYRYWGVEAQEARAWSFDTHDGSYSAAGDANMEEIYGKESLTTRIEVDQALLNELWRSCKKLEGHRKLPAKAEAGGPNTMEIDLCITAAGKETRYYYSGPVRESPEDLRLLRGMIPELEHLIAQRPSINAWWQELEKIAAERRQARSEEIVLALREAFDEKYGPGNTPDYYLGYRILEGGYLEIGIRSETDRKVWDQHAAEIKALLYQKGYSEGFMYYLED